MKRKQSAQGDNVALTKKTAEARARSGAVVAETTARAVHALRPTIPTHDIGARGALNLRAVRAAESLVALAAVLLVALVAIVGRSVLEAARDCKTELRLA